MSSPLELDPAWSRELEVFYGRSSDAVTRLYVRCQRPAAPGEWELSGSVWGPEVAASRTLPARSPLRDAGPGETLLAEAVIPDLCVWRAALPAMYRLLIEIRHAGRVVQAVELHYGVNQAGVVGKDLRIAGRRTVLRFVDRALAPAADWSDWNAADAAMLLNDPDPRTCQLASRHGVRLIVALTRNAELELALRELSRWPAVTIVFPPATTSREWQAPFVGNLLLGQLIDAPADAVPDAAARVPDVAPWAEVVGILAPDSGPVRIPSVEPGQPTLFMRPATQLPHLTSGRSACDLLQRELAGKCRPAGFGVIASATWTAAISGPGR